MLSAMYHMKTPAGFSVLRWPRAFVGAVSCVLMFLCTSSSVDVNQRACEMVHETPLLNSWCLRFFSLSEGRVNVSVPVPCLYIKN